MSALRQAAKDESQEHIKAPLLSMKLSSYQNTFNHTFHLTFTTIMSNRLEREAEDRYEAQNDPSPVSGRVSDNTYAHETRSGLRDYIPVQGDNQSFEDPIQPPYSNTDQQLGMMPGN